MNETATRFQNVRDAHQTETAEDYVETIADLINTQGEARVVDLANYMGVTAPTANKVIARLQKEGLVDTKPYRSLHLTDQGEKLAKHCKERHQVVVDFLVAIGVPKDIAELDAEGIEHHVSEATLERFREFGNLGKPQ